MSFELEPKGKGTTFGFGHEALVYRQFYWLLKSIHFLEPGFNTKDGKFVF